MPKIKTINNATLKKYLEAYSALLAVEPNMTEYKEKIDAIKKALENRSVSGFDIEKTNIAQKLTGMFSFLKKKK